MDNVHLLTEAKQQSKEDPKLIQARYKYGMCLMGLALLNEYNSDDSAYEGGDMFKNIQIVSQAISPFLIPMTKLGELAVDALN